MTTLRLYHGSTNTSLELYPRAGDITELASLDLGFPEIREVSEQRADTDGEIDQTKYHDGRVISVELHLLDLPLTQIDEIVGFAPPGRRVWLLVGEDEWGGERRIRARLASRSLKQDVGLRGYGVVQLQYKCPEGTFESLTTQTQSFGAATATGAGTTLPNTLPMAFPVTANSAGTVIEHGGTVPVHWVGRIYGPCTDPALINDTTGMRLAFTGLNLAAGEYLEVSTLNRSALLNGVADASRLGLLNFAASTWWQLQPGTNSVRFLPSSLGTGARAEITWRQAWI